MHIQREKETESLSVLFTVGAAKLPTLGKKIKWINSKTEEKSNMKKTHEVCSYERRGALPQKRSTACQSANVV